MLRDGRRAFALALVLFGIPAATATAAPSLRAHGSAAQVYATGTAPGARLELLDRRGRRVQSRRADALGGVVFRNVGPGGGYRVAQGATRSGPLTVFSDRPAPPSTKIYNQQIPASGYGYLATRDGTTLAIDVHLPSGPGPYPTLVEYSGYGYADPAGAESSIAADRQPARLRRRGRQHARHRLLRWVL